MIFFQDSLIQMKIS